jgi:hypothetical protein
VAGALEVVLGQEMELKVGDWVSAPNGEQGKVVNISKLTVFVAFAREGREDRADTIAAFLESQLTKLELPPDPDSRL